MPPVTCPYCGNSAELVSGHIVHDPRHAYVWRCAPCRAWVGVFPDSPRYLPMGRLAKDDLRRLQVRAFRVFNAWWIENGEKLGLKRSEARKVGYAWLSRRLRIPTKDCDIGWMNETWARRVIEVVEKQGRRLAA